MDMYTANDITNPDCTEDSGEFSLRDVFARNLKYYRKRNKLSQERLSIAINMSSTYINGIENRSSFPQPEVIQNIARVLKIKPYQLFMEDGCPENIIYYDKEQFISGVVSDISSNVIKNLEDKIRNALK